LAKKKSTQKGILGSLKSMIAPPSNQSNRAKKAKRTAKKQDGDLPARDQLAPFIAPTIDLDPLVHPTKNLNTSIPPRINLGTLLVSQRHGLKCILLEPLEHVEISLLKKLCLRKLNDGPHIVYLPLGTNVLKDEVLHQGREFVTKLRKGSLFLSPGGHPNGYLLEAIGLPLRKELSSNNQFMPLTEASAKRSLQKLVDLPPNFALIKEDLLHDAAAPVQKVEKGSLVISRGGALTGLMLEDVQLPLKKSVVDLTALFALKTTYHSFPLETLLQQASKSGGREIPIERGTFLFSPHGKVFFVWREGVTASEKKLKNWSTAPTIIDPNILLVSVTRSNIIGGPGAVITQDEINYLRDVFKTAGSTNIYRETLLMDNNVFFKFVQDIPYAHTGKFRAFIHTGQIVQLNTFRKGTFSVEIGGSRIEVTDLDLVQIRKHLQATGRILIKIGTLLRIRDERAGDWVYRATNNLFYPYEELTRAHMEEFIPETVAFDHRAEKQSTLIGPQKQPHDDDIGANGDPLADLTALINNELSKDRTVFVLDGTLFFWRKRLYRVNEEIVFRPQHHSKIENSDLEAFEVEWKIHPVVEDAIDSDDELPPDEFEDEDLEDLPFDTSARS
jgi:hypothetical protein